MVTSAAPEQVARSRTQPDGQQTEDGTRRAVGGPSVQMLLMLQRTVGNQAVNQLLRQYRSGGPSHFGLLMPSVQRCGGKACACSPQEKAAHAAARPLEEEPAPVTSDNGLANIQRDAGDDDGSGDNGGGAGQASGAASAPDADGASGQSAAAAEAPSAVPDDQDAARAAPPASNPDDASSTQAAGATDTATTQPDADGGGQSASATNQDAGEQTAGAGDGGNADAGAGDAGNADAGAGSVAPVAAVEGEGEPHDEVVFGGNSLQLQGRTNAHFRNRFSAPNMTTTAGTGCGCADANCVHITGVLTSTFTMTTDVSLPPVPSGLSDCQQRTVRAAISTCLSPHEQQHVAAFNAYRGTVQTPFDTTCCRSDVPSTLQGMHDAIEGPRHDAVQASSDALDPFQVDIDLDCRPGDDPNAGVHCPSP